MTIGGAFTNSIQAIQAQADALAQISRNVANVNTTGYKKQVDNFQTMLSESTAGTNIFGVQVASRMSSTFKAISRRPGNGTIWRSTGPASRSEFRPRRFGQHVLYARRQFH